MPTGLCRSPKGRAFLKAEGRILQNTVLAFSVPLGSVGVHSRERIHTMKENEREQIVLMPETAGKERRSSTPGMIAWDSVLEGRWWANHSL